MPDLEKLGAYLLSDDAHPDSMGLSDLDGFLTGIACSPEEVPEDEWLNHALGNAEETPDAILELVHDMLGDIIERLVHSGPLVTCHRIFPPFGIRVRPNEGTDNEAIKIQRRTDFWHPDGA